MKKTLFLFLLVIFGSVTLAGCQLEGLAGQQNEAAEEEATASPTETMAAEPQTDQMEMSFVDLMKLGENYKCSYSYEDEGNKVTGMAYVAGQGNKVNGEFVMTTAEGQQYNSYVISDGEYSYVWSDMQNQGIKMKIDEDPASIFGDEQMETEDNEEPTQFNQDQQMKFDCEKWIPENSKFIPPTGIEFVDFSEQMQQIGDQVQGAMDDACDSCDQLPAGDAQDQCRSALGC